MKKRLRSKERNKDRDRDETMIEDDWGGLALVLTISQTLHIINPTCPSDHSTPMGSHVESQPVLASMLAGTEVVVGTMNGDVVGWGFDEEVELEPASGTFDFQLLDSKEGQVRISVEGTGIVESGSVKKRVDERDGPFEVKLEPREGSWVVSYKQDGGGREVLSKVILQEQEEEVDVGVVVGGIIVVVCAYILS
mmetsp:Transcript_20878/g.43581  ORF Transcript_20878/g.43581 Transcript_20878/m.43581 type:complete len:194 (+) Transcript_20878:3-584(+)